VKLLLDENVSGGIVQQIADLFPASTHVKALGMNHVEDRALWEWSKHHEFILVSKDTDFYQMAIVLGHPPKFIWLRVGNCSTTMITNLLRSRYEVIREFVERESESVLVLER
jgi:predicted nuclease of predicted toxin-antitoxin system